MASTPTRSVNNETDERTPLVGSKAARAFSIHGSLTKSFVKWGAWVMKLSPLGLKGLVLIPLIIAMGLTVGSINLNREERPEKLWLVQDDWVLQDRLYRQSRFERATEEALLITANTPSGDMLEDSKNLLEEVYKLHLAVMNISITAVDPLGHSRVFTTEDLCLRSNMSAYYPDRPCLVTTVFAFWEYNYTALTIDPDPHATLTSQWNGATDPMTGGPLLPEQVVGGVEYDTEGAITKASALKLWYYLDNNFTINNAWPGFEDDVLGAWEDAFLLLASRDYPDLTVYRHAANSDGDVMADAMNDDLPYVITALMAVIFMVVFYILMSPAMLHDGFAAQFSDRALRSFVAFVVAGLSMSSTMGIIGLTGLPFSGVVWYMIFYVLIHACHSMALLVNAVDVVCVGLPSQARIGAALGAVAPTMLTTSVPIILMFFGLCVTAIPLPGVRTLALAGCFGLTINLALLFTSFFGVLARTFRRPHDADMDALPRPPCSGVRAIMSFYRWAGQSWLFKSVVVLCVLGMAGDSISGCISWRQQASEAAVYPSSSYLHKFYVKDDDYFGKLRIPVDFVMHELDYTDPANGHALLQLTDNLLASPYLSVPPVANYSRHFSWYSGFLSFAVNQHVPLPGGVFPPSPDLFYNLLYAWPMVPESDPAFSVFWEFAVNILLKHNDSSIGPLNPFDPTPSNNGHITNTRFQAFSAVLSDMDSQANAVEALHSITSAAGGNVIASLYAPPFFIFRTFTTIREWTNYALIATGVACTISIALSLTPMVALIVLVSAGSVGLDTVGLFMKTIGYSFDSSTLPMLMFMIPLATELLVHFAAFSRVEFRLPHMPTKGEKGVPLPISAAAAAVAYGPATATVCCGCLGALVGLLVMMAGVTSPVLYVFGALSAFIIGIAGVHVLVLPAFLPW